MTYASFNFTGPLATHTLLDPEGYRYRGNYLVEQGEYHNPTARSDPIGNAADADG